VAPPTVSVQRGDFACILPRRVSITHSRCRPVFIAFGISQGTLLIHVALAPLREAVNIGTAITRTLILDRDFRPGRTAIVLVREPIGI
jgi:hypothetical protein